MSRTSKDRARHGYPANRGRGPARSAGFRCRHCGAIVGPVLYGGHHRNHCPFCLYSTHVDLTRLGDRSNECGGLMEPIGAFTRPKGEHVIVHRCLMCGFERYNRIAGDDDFEKVLALPVVPPRGGPESRATASGEQADPSGQA